MVDCVDLLMQQEVPPKICGINKRKRIFEKNQDHKSGKWSTDEEKYARWLVEEFQKGTLRDCESGSTLRSYLARKLACSPMRVSKKFAGLRIGKLVFAANVSHLCCDSPLTSCASWDSSSECSTASYDNQHNGQAVDDGSFSDRPMDAFRSESFHESGINILSPCEDPCVGSDLGNTFGRLTADVPPLVSDALYGVEICPNEEQEKSTTLLLNFPQPDPIWEADEWVFLSSLLQDSSDPFDCS